MSANAQSGKVYWKRSSPDSIIISQTDLHNYWTAFDSCMTTSDSLRQISFIQKYYIDKATTGLKGLNAKDDLHAEDYVDCIRLLPKYLNSIRNTTLSFRKHEHTIRNAYRKLKRLYPTATFSDIYFLISPLKHGGTPVEGGFIIGTEMLSNDKHADLSAFSPKQRNMFASPDLLPALVVHENVHTMQLNDNGKSTLLKRSLLEGSAEFITRLVLNRTAIKQSTYDYLTAHEASLWREFLEDIKTNNQDKWFMSDQYEDRLPDLGYIIGYKICEAYYQQSKNKQKAIADIIQMEKAPEIFLKESGYATKTSFVSRQ
ncbi:hypothetical protein TH53_15805 [Pedobacter lusitanus]|uniref:DUF2268 domain-containing protein n=1 Tax=Pedobacter lusitanus TaxID=1503925 RepID=A0A0D0GPB0_9SPHI|nr:hypothetical protein TH53_15805 [Pedobacter lusitanus]